VYTVAIGSLLLRPNHIETTIVYLRHPALRAQQAHLWQRLFEEAGACCAPTLCVALFL
jgi:hypothetical protein